MIECKNDAGKIIGYVEDKQYLDESKELWGYLEGKITKAKDGYPLLVLQEDGAITLDDGEKLGYLKESKVYNSSNAIVFQFVKDRRQIQNRVGQLVLALDGPARETEILTDLDYFGISAIILELFA
jgi:hypothetical protein